MRSARDLELVLSPYHMDKSLLLKVHLQVYLDCVQFVHVQDILNVKWMLNEQLHFVINILSPLKGLRHGVLQRHLRFDVRNMTLTEIHALF